MPDLGADGIFKIAAYLVVILLLGVGGHSVIRRRVSKDNVQIAADHGHIDVISILRKERDTLAERMQQLTVERDDALRAHSEAMLEIGGLRTEVLHLREKITDQATLILGQSVKIEALQKQVGALRDHIDSLMGLTDAGLPPPPGRTDE